LRDLRPQLGVRFIYLDDLAPSAAPPDRLDEPVCGGRRLRPSLVREQHNSGLTAAWRAAAVAVVTQQLAGAPAAILVVVQLDHDDDPRTKHTQ